MLLLGSMNMEQAQTELDKLAELSDKFSRYYRKHHAKCVATRKAYYEAHKEAILARAKEKRAEARRMKDGIKADGGDLKAWLRVWSHF